MTDKARDPRALNSVKGDVPATSQIQMRVTPDIKARYVTQARREGMKLSEWIQLHLNAVCDKAEADRQWEEKIAENNKYFRIYRKRDNTWRKQSPGTDRLGMPYPDYTDNESEAGIWLKNEIRAASDNPYGHMHLREGEELIESTPTRDQLELRAWLSD